MKREVPAFEAVVFKPRATRFCLCIPVLNENGRLHAQLARMAPFLRQVDVVVADGGSSDGSVAADVLQPLGVSRALDQKRTGPIGRAIAHGLCLGPAAGV